jgi:hypothetical protein
MTELRGEPGARAPLLGTLKDMLRKALEMGVFLHSGPTGELWRICSFGREFERKVRFYQETLFIGESERCVKEGSQNRQLSS